MGDIHHHHAIGCGAVLGVGGAVGLVLGMITVGRAVLGQLEGAARVLITVAEIALCVVIGAVAAAVLGGVAFGVQLARLHLAERRAALPATVRAEVVSDPAPQLADDRAVSHGLTSGNTRLTSVAGSDPEKAAYQALRDGTVPWS